MNFHEVLRCFLTEVLCGLLACWRMLRFSFNMPRNIKLTQTVLPTSPNLFFLQCSAPTFPLLSDFFPLPFPFPSNPLLCSSIVLSSLASAELVFHFFIDIIIIIIFAVCVCVCVQVHVCHSIYMEIREQLLGVDSLLSWVLRIKAELWRLHTKHFTSGPIFFIPAFFSFYIITYYRNTFKLHSYKTTKWGWEFKLCYSSLHNSPWLDGVYALDKYIRRWSTPWSNAYLPSWIYSYCRKTWTKDYVIASLNLNWNWKCTSHIFAQVKSSHWREQRTPRPLVSEVRLWAVLQPSGFRLRVGVGEKLIAAAAEGGPSLSCSCEHCPRLPPPPPPPHILLLRGRRPGRVEWLIILLGNRTLGFDSSGSQCHHPGFLGTSEAQEIWAPSVVNSGLTGKTVPPGLGWNRHAGYVTASSTFPAGGGFDWHFMGLITLENNTKNAVTSSRWKYEHKSLSLMN